MFDYHMVIKNIIYLDFINIKLFTYNEHIEFSLNIPFKIFLHIYIVVGLWNILYMVAGSNLSKWLIFYTSCILLRYNII